MEAPHRIDLEVFVSTTTSQEEMPTDNCNQPATRRDAILNDLRLGASLKVRVNDVPLPLDPSLAAARCAHDSGYVAFLNTAWDRWAPLEQKDDTFCRYANWRQESNQNDSGDRADVAQSKEVIPSMIPGNGANRDPCVRPGTSVTSQCTFYAADQEAPIYEGLVAALAADLAVTRAALIAAYGSSNGDASNSASRGSHSTGASATYALVTHPGHHASRDSCAGYCYINSAAILAKQLGKVHSKVAVLDVDYHCGNGTIGIFWHDPSVYVCSIHADPDKEYPYTCGFADQTGGPGAEGATRCLPLAPGATWDGAYAAAIEQAINEVIAFGATALVVSLGVDTLSGDPVAVPGAGFDLHLHDYLKLGAALRRADLPTVFVQEGGYDLARVGPAVGNTLRGFCNPASASSSSSSSAAAAAAVLPRTDALSAKRLKNRSAAK